MHVRILAAEADNGYCIGLGDIDLKVDESFGEHKHVSPVKNLIEKLTQRTVDL